ncbi:uncharacterized protein [Dendropsophus ebraccatus]|uniref:uncharacterized protein n=1 Tax=Dendropsophus ebraccatus TaxID=150705 RepID=UPI003831162B
MYFYLVILLLQNPGGGHCAVTVSQPPAIAAMLGSSANLTCYMKVEFKVTLNRVNVYWYIPDGNRVKENLFPKLSTKNSRLIDPTLQRELSLTIDNVQLPYTDTYVCETSLLIGTRNTRSTGNGTYLLVYDNFTTSMNHRDIICTVRVQAHKNVDLFWRSQDHEFDNVTSSVNQATNGSFWIFSVLTKETQRCRPHQNLTFTCNLQYMQQSLAESSIEVTCAGDPQPPIFLYVSVLANSLLVLLAVIIISFWMKKRSDRGVQLGVPYENCSASLKRKYNS